MIAASSLYFGQPWWLLTGLLSVPAVVIALRCQKGIGIVRRMMAIVMRVAVIVLLAVLLARPMIGQRSEDVTVVAVVDRSLSVSGIAVGTGAKTKNGAPATLESYGVDFLAKAVEGKRPNDRLAIVDVAEHVEISKLPSPNPEFRRRSISALGHQSRLADGVQMAMAIAPPDTATRLLLISDGNETDGDLTAVARIAASNGIPIDVLPLRYDHKREVVFTRLAAPSQALNGQSIPLRFVLNSTSHATGQLQLMLNGRPVDLSPDDEAGLGMKVTLKPGTNVKTVVLPAGSRGVYEYEAHFICDDSAADGISRNNRAAAITMVSGKGHVLIVGDNKASEEFTHVLSEAGMQVRQKTYGEFPDNLAAMMGVDAVVLIDADSGSFTYAQQELLCKYVEDTAGGLLMIGGPNSYGAGGWIGSPTARILPVDMDPPHKKEMPKGALVLLMHACEMPRGNYWGRQVAKAAVNALSRKDLVGVAAFYGGPDGGTWVHPLSEAGDKKAVNNAINTMNMGDMPDFAAPMTTVLKKLQTCGAVQKHMIIISDGDPSPPSPALLKKFKSAGITCTGVAVFPHSPNDVFSLKKIARATGGRFYNVKNAASLPQIFVKEARVVRRSLIVEKTFTPTIVSGGSEIIKGITSLPRLDGYMLTGDKGGFANVVLRGPDNDPIMATCQAGLGRSVAFMSTADGRWAEQWVGWGGFSGFWEQVVQWTSRSTGSRDCEIFTDIHGGSVDVGVEAVDAEGKFVQFAAISAEVTGPNMATRKLGISQVGPGAYRAAFRTRAPGSYLLNVKYRKLGAGSKTKSALCAVTIPYAAEFRDLTDNAALLSQVARMTGGRVLTGDPEQADLFSREKLGVFEDSREITMPLIIVWIVLFLLDVAIRRVSIDIRAMYRGVAGLLSFRRRAVQADSTLSALQRRRSAVRDTMDAQGAARFETPDGTEQDELETVDVTRTAKQTPPKTSPQKEKEDKNSQNEAPYLQQLLRTKRKSAGRLKGPKGNTGDK